VLADTISTDQDVVWVTAGGDLSRINPATNRAVVAVKGVVPVVKGQRCEEPGVAAADDQAVWLIWCGAARGTAVVIRVDPRTNREVGRIRVGDNPSGMAIGGGSVWVTIRSENAVIRIDPNTNAVTGQLIGVGKGPWHPAFGDGVLWIPNNDEGSITRIDA
jgi:DNA-binding beta-propeller fold protein YncE